MCAGGAFDAAEAETLQAGFDVFQCEDKVVGPKRGTFADGGGLGGLKVCEAEGGKIAVFDGETAECIDHTGEF